MFKKIGILLVAALLSTAASCNKGLPPNTAPEDKIAVRATQFSEALRVANKELPKFECGPGVEASLEKPCLGASEAKAIYSVIVKVAEAGEKELASALTIVDNAKTVAERRNGLDRAAAIIKQLAADLESAKIRALNPEVRAKVVTALQTASNILLVITLF